MKHRLVHLDCLRGVAALLVCLEHLRAFLFVPFAQLKSPNALERAFYFVTGLGHQAVMIFFVLSGFLVGGSVLSGMFPRLCAPRSALPASRPQWSWTGYALRRMTRLWMVLIPALLLTLLWDQMGQRQSPAGYDGAFRAAYNSGPTPAVPTDLSPVTFWGNSFFLQTITVNCFGTNGPLWSLANEFWYYLLFPLLLGIFLQRGNSEKLKTEMLKQFICALLAVAGLVLLPWEILRGGLVWLMGAGVYILIQNERVRSWIRQIGWIAGSGLLMLALLAGSRFGKLGGWDDLLLGLGCAALVAGLAVRPSSPLRLDRGEGQGEVSNPTSVASPWLSVFQHFSVSAFTLYSRLSAGASEFSYTLYLVHFPLLAFLFFTTFHGRQLQPGLVSALWFAGVLAGVLLYAAAIYWCFERNTDRIRRRIEKWMVPPALLKTEMVP